MSKTLNQHWRTKVARETILRGMQILHWE